MSINSFRKHVFYIAIVFYGVAATNSTGYHQEDEHYQIVGFAEYRLGNTKDVSWEYKQRLRSTIQPVICMGIFSLFRAFNVTDPFYLALCLRLITAALSVAVITFFAETCLPDLSEKYRKWFLIMSFFLWFLPYINVRFSSEAWSGLLSLLSVALVKNIRKDKKDYQYALIGLVLGLAILFRFQALVFVFGILCWCIFIGKIKGRHVFIIVSSVILALLIGFLIDCWFYQKITCSLYNYIHVNVVENIASIFGRSPWYYILLYIIKAPVYPIGLLLLFSVLILLICKPTSIYLWCIIPFLILHTISPHKELRFLFPLVNFCPIIFFLAVQNVQSFILRLNRYVIGLICLFLILINAIGLIVVCTRSARKGDAEIADYIYHHFSGQKINLITSEDANPFDPQMGFKEHFYKGKYTQVNQISSLWTPDFRYHIKKGYINLLVMTHLEYTGKETQKRLEDFNFKLIKNTLPKPYDIFVKWYDDTINDRTITGGVINENQLLLYRCLN